MAALLDVRLLVTVAIAAALLAVLGAWRPQLVLPGTIALGVVLTRPSTVGERIPVLGPALIVAGAGLCLLQALRERSVDRGPFPWPFLLLALAWVWLGLHALLAPGSEPSLGTSTLTVFVPVMAAYLVVRDPDLLARVRTALVGLVVVTGALVVIALAAIVVVGSTATLVGTAPLGYAEGVGVYLPGALSYGLDPSALLPRMVGLGREPGVGALFLGWAFFAMPTAFPYPRTSQAVLVLALLGTQSTAGIGLFGACVVLRAVLGRTRFSPWAATAAVLGGAAVVWLAVFSTGFGLLAKIDSPGDSFGSRNQATLNGLHELVSHPFTATTTADLSSINLIAAIAVNGAPWAFLMAAFLLAPVLRAGRRDPLRYGSLFVLLVMLTAQPLAGNAAVLLLALIAFYAADRPERHVPQPLVSVDHAHGAPRRREEHR